jgi:hypothetical protein
MSVFFRKMFLEKWRKVSDRVLGGYCRGTRELWSTGGYYRGVVVGHV